VTASQLLTFSSYCGGVLGPLSLMEWLSEWSYSLA